MEYEIGQANRLGNRDVNQDRFAAVETGEGVLLVLADGMGGHAHGETAAQTLVDTARRVYLELPRPLKDPQQFFYHVIHLTHDAMLDLGMREGLSVAPGTTGVLCLIENGHLHWAHVGDSRMYLFRDGLPIFRTRDHSYVEQLYERGAISREERESHPKRNHVTQCIGCLAHEPLIEYGRGKQLQQGDVVLLCTDGLWGALDDAQIGELLHRSRLEQAVDAMTEHAERASYPHSDNISVIALRFLARDSARQGRKGSQRGRRRGEDGKNDEEKLRTAIRDIEQVLREYEKELKH